MKKILTFTLVLLAYITANAQPYPGITVNSKLYTDDIWFFGNGTPGCPGVLFTKNSADKWSAQSYSGIAQVSAGENCLSVSTPSCSGSFVFYTSNNVIYNSKHQPMSGNIGLGQGVFYGNNSVADGLAACYVGNNKYFLFSDTKSYEGGTKPADDGTCSTYGCVGLRYYIVDMSGDNGYGSFTYGGKIEAVGMSESIELIPVAGTTDEYWLVYHYYAGSQMRVRKVTPSGVSGVVKTLAQPNVSIGSYNTGYSYLLKSNATYNRLALSMPTLQRVYLFHFNPATGDIAFDHYIDASGVGGATYGIEFSPQDKYLYYAGYQSTTLMAQYNLSTKTTKTFTFNNIAGNRGSGLKRGPDGKMYVALYSSYLGVINKPDEDCTTAGFYTQNGLNLGMTVNNLPLSTGITPPAVDPPSITTPPTTVADVAITTNTMPVTVSVLDNDTYNNGNALKVSNAFFTDPAKATQGTITVDATGTKVIFTPNFAHGFTDGEVVNITYVAKDNGTPVPMCNSEQLQITVRTSYKSSSTLFNDNVWFFGNTWSGPGCPAITFEKDGGGNWRPKDITATEGAQVDSWENSLSVSTPACDGSFVFYTSHDYVYNSNHVPMKGKPKGTSSNNGEFWGHTSVADGLGACYVGNNKYFLFSSSNCYNNATIEGGIIRLRYYIIDMSGDNGLGEIRLPSAADGITDGLTDGIIVSSGMSESVEVIPVPGTYDQYWLIYHTEEATRKMVVRKVTPTGISAPVCTITSQATALSYVLNSNTNHTMLSMVLPGAHKVLVYNFNPVTGQISHRNTFDFPVATYPGSKYGTLFSPNGRYLYATSWQGTRMIQYDLTNNSVVGSIEYNLMGAASERGGGMKMGPDGKIYVAHSYTRYLGRIETPDLPITNAGFTYNRTAVELGLPAGTTYRNLPLSTGLTPPAMDPPGTNHTPTTVPDAATLVSILPVTVSPLANDSYNPLSNATQLYLTRAQLVNAGDAAKGTLSFNATAKTVTFTPDQNHTFTDGETILISYTARDNQTPVGMCENGIITLTVSLPQLTVTIPSPKTFDEGTTVPVEVCLPTGVTAPAAGLVVTLTQVASTAPQASAADYSMPASLTLAAGERCKSFNVVLNNDLLVEEGNESLKVQATAKNCKTGNDQLTVTDITPGDVEVVVAPASVSEGPTPGTATLTFRFKEANVTCTKRVKVVYAVTELSPTTGAFYTASGTSPAYIEIGASKTDVTITTINDFTVDGGRSLTVLISSVTTE